MDIYQQADFDRHLILGLKQGLMKADREIRELKDKLFKYIMRCMDLKTKLGANAEKHHETSLAKNSEIETLKKKLEKLEDSNMHLSFQLSQQCALSEERVKEIESLKNENLKLTKVSQKEENLVKYGALKRKLKTILRNRQNYDDSKVLQDVANVISDRNPKYNKSSSKSCPAPNVSDTCQFNSIIKVNDIEIKIQSLPSPTSSLLSIQSLSEKSPAASSISDVSEAIESNRSPSDSGYTTVDCDEQVSPHENSRKNNEEMDFKIEYSTNGKHDECSSEEPEAHNSYNIEREFSVSKEICDKELESRADKLDENSNSHDKSIISHSSLPMIDDETLESKPMEMNSIFEPLIEERTSQNSLPIIDCDIGYCQDKSIRSHSSLPMIDDETPESEPIKKNSIFEPLIEERTSQNSLPIIDCDIGYCQDKSIRSHSSLPMIDDETPESEPIKKNSIFEPLIEEETSRNSLPFIDCDIGHCEDKSIVACSTMPIIDDGTPESKPMKKNSIFEPLIEEETSRNSLPIMNCDIKYCKSEAKDKVSIFEPVFESRYVTDETKTKSESSRLLVDRELVENSSHESCEDIVIDGNKLLNPEPTKKLLIPSKSDAVIGPSTLVEHKESKGVKSKPTTTDKVSTSILSKTDRLFIDVRPLDDPVDVILQEMAVFLSSREEADELEEFYQKLLNEELKAPEKRNESVSSLSRKKNSDSNMGERKPMCKSTNDEVISSSDKLASSIDGTSELTRTSLKKNLKSSLLAQTLNKNNSSNKIKGRWNGLLIKTAERKKDSVSTSGGKPSKIGVKTRGDIPYEKSESQVSSHSLIEQEKEVCGGKPTLSSQNPSANYSNPCESSGNAVNVDLTSGLVTDSKEVSCGNGVADKPNGSFKVSESLIPLKSNAEMEESSLQRNITEKGLVDNKIHAGPKSDTKDIDIFSVLNKLSEGYEILRQERADMNQFAQNLISESRDGNETEASEATEYVVMIQTRDSDCPSSERSIDVRDILNDWIGTDSITEIDLRNEEVELKDSHLLEFTSKSSSDDEDVFRLQNSSERIYLEVQDERVDNVVCWMDKEDALESKKRTTSLEKESSSEPDGRNFEEEPNERSKRNTEQESSVQKIIVAEDEGGTQEESDCDDMCLTIAEDDELEKDAGESQLVIAEDEVMVPECLDYRLELEDEKVEQESENVKSFEDVGHLGKNNDVYNSVESTDSEPARYNLRRKSTLDYASIVKNSACRKRTLNNSDGSPVRKVFKSNSSRSPISPSIGKENISVSLKSDPNDLSKDETNKDNPCLPKFYVEIRPETRRSHALSEKTHFESVLQVVKNLPFDQSQSTRSQESSLVCCRDSILRTAFNFNSQTGPKSPKERVFNFTKVKNHLEEYLREKKHSPRGAIANLLANVKFTNQTTLCCAIETILLHSSRDKIAKNANILNNSLLMYLNANVFNDLIFVCLEIDKNVFGGFIAAMKALLKQKMFAKTFTVDNNSSNLNMISSTIVHSCFFTLLCKATKNVDDAVDLLYDSLMFMKNRAHPVAYGVFIQWRDILMKYQSFKHKLPCIDIILFCFVHHKMLYNGDLYRVSEVQELIREMYSVKLGEKTAEEHARETMMKIDLDGWVDAIVLLCKRQMFSWTYTNVIMKYLMPLLRVWKTDSISEVVLLKSAQALRRIMLSCPYDKEELKSYNFDEMVKVLSHILFNENMSSRALKEFVYLAICELSSRRFPQCAELLSSWMPADRKFSSEVLSLLNETMNKKMMYAKWCTFIAPEKTPGRFPLRRTRNVGNNESGKSNIPEGKNIISVGLTRSSRTQTTQQPKTEGKKKKKKKKKKGKQKKKANH